MNGVTEDLAALAAVASRIKKADGPIPAEFIFERTEIGPFFNFAQRLACHSPGGMDWGNSGPGSADAAFNVLIYFCDGASAWDLHQDFMEAIIAKLPSGGRSVVASGRVRKWIAEQARRKWTAAQSLDESLF